MVMKMMAMMPIDCLSVLIRSRDPARGPAGPASLRSVVTIQMVARNSSVRMIPGMTPARNSRPIACSVSRP
jgi:hypothetical protein